ncbi:DNA primase [Brochothrix thermosphacta]|uniref:DNA primase n=1 Tax=Brochothrix thermosphacta TaxID=2756 RepID=UPI000D7B42C4|nr:DNA primase [Brochothrix thermosphacta]SPN75020.1 putative DNA primase [Brochothrix thermosphacta]
MSRRIPEELVTRIQQENDIVDVVSDYVQLKKQGRNYSGLCPFHNEKTPSLSVSPEKQIFHCFGCGKGGNMFTFLMESEGISFQEAALKLAERSHIPIGDLKVTTSGDQTFQEPRIEDQETHSMIEAHALVAQLYHYILTSTEEGTIALDYLHERGLTDEVIREYNIGFAPKSWELVTAFLEKRGFDYNVMIDAGLLARRDDGNAVDRFRERVMFPITNDRGQTIAFSGRLLPDVEGPKYLNSPETLLFNKRNVLFNFAAARKAIRQTKSVTIFEGFMDVIAASQAGVTNGVASMGTSLTPEHIAKLKRVTDRLIVCYDGDSAGLNATYKAVQLIQEARGLNVKIISLPEKLDPDEYIRKKGAEAFKDFYEQQQIEWPMFLMRYLGTIQDLNQADEIANYVDTLLDEISRIDRPIEQEVYLTELEQRTKIDRAVLRQQLATRQPQTAYEETFFQPQTQQVVKRTALDKMERYLVLLMLKDTQFFDQIQQKFEASTLSFYHDDYQAIYTYLLPYYLQGNIADVAQFLIEVKDERVKNIIVEMEMEELPNIEDVDIADCCYQLDKLQRLQDFKRLKQEQIDALNANDSDKVRAISLEIISKKRALDKL